MSNKPATSFRLPVLQPDLTTASRLEQLSASHLAASQLAASQVEAPVGEREWAEDELLQVGDVAKATGKTVRALHLYESLGLIRPQERSKGRYRLFAPDTVLRVRWIGKLQNLGLSLPEIQELARAREQSGSALFAASQLRSVYDRQLKETRVKLRELQALEHELESALSYLGSCDDRCIPELPTSSCSCCERHGEPTAAPELVAGANVN